MCSLSAPLLEELPAPYTPVTFDLTGEVAPFEEKLSLAGWVFAPPTVPEKPVVLLCFPGGSYTKAYYHLEVPGYPVDHYSAALALARAGCIVVVLDHLGVGESTAPDGTLLTLEVLARANAAASRQIQERLQAGSLIFELPPLAELVMIGIGHSMGAFVLVEQQATSNSFAAIALLGYTNHLPSLPSGTGSVDDLFSPPHKPTYIASDRRDFEAFFYTSDVPRSVIEEDASVASACPVGILMEMQVPGLMLPRAARIEVPVFLANGDLDLSPAFREEVTTYPASHDITLFHVAGSAHCHAFAATSHLLWKRLALWCQAQAA